MFKKILSLSKREKYFLYITLGVVLFGVVCNFLVFPIFTKWNENKRDIKKKKIKLEKSYSLLDRAKQIENWNKNFPFNLKASEIKENKITQILSYIEIMSKKTSVQIINIAPGDIEEHGDYKLSFVNLVVKGDMKNIVQFLYNIESSPMVFTVEELQLEADRIDSAKMKVFLEISKLII